MRFVSLILALCVGVVLYLWVIERDSTMAFLSQQFGGDAAEAVEEARADQARARFERAGLEAWDKGEDFALRYANEETRLARLRTAAESSARAVELAREQYAAGLVDLQVGLDTQRVLLGLSEQFAASQGALTKNWIALGRATSAGRLAIESPSG